MPTLLEAAGVAPPPGLRLDGRSLLPLLEGRDVEWPERTIYIQSHRGDIPVRHHHFAARGPRWKLLRATGFGNETPAPSVPFELYDLSTDPREEHNVAADHPEIVARMRAEYDRWFDDVSTTRPDNYAPPRITVGSDRETISVLTRQEWRRLKGRGWGSAGEWLLTFEGEHAYDVRVITEKEIGEARVDLRIGSVKREKSFSAPAKSFLLRDIRLPAGDASLKVTVSRGQDTIPPYHVVVLRR